MALSAYEVYKAEMQKRFSKGEQNHPAPLIAGALQNHADFIGAVANKPGTFLVFNKEDEFGLEAPKNEWTIGLTAPEFEAARAEFEAARKYWEEEMAYQNPHPPLGNIAYAHEVASWGDHHYDKDLHCYASQQCLYHKVEVMAYAPGDFRLNGVCIEPDYNVIGGEIQYVTLESLEPAYGVYKEKTVWEAPGGPYSRASSEWWWFVPAKHCFSSYPKNWPNF